MSKGQGYSINFNEEKIFNSLAVVSRVKNSEMGSQLGIETSLEKKYLDFSEKISRFKENDAGGTKFLIVEPFKYKQSPGKKNTMLKSLSKAGKWINIMEATKVSDDTKDLCIYILLMHKRILDIINRKSGPKSRGAFKILEEIETEITEQGAFKKKLYEQPIEAMEMERIYFDLLMDSLVIICKASCSKSISYYDMVKEVLEKEKFSANKLTETLVEYIFDPTLNEIGFGYDSKEDMGASWIKKISLSTFKEATTVLTNFFFFKLSEEAVNDIKNFGFKVSSYVVIDSKYGGDQSVLGSDFLDVFLTNQSHFENKKNDVFDSIEKIFSKE